MALFKRKDLEGKGLTGEQIDYILTESNRARAADYMPKSSLQEEIDKAMQKNPKQDVTKSEEYQKVVSERDMLRALGTEDFANVKPKFRETVYRMLDRGEEAKPISEQMNAIAEEYEEYFTQTEEPEKAPQFGAKTEGTMPKGKESKSFGDYWGFGK